MAGAQERSSVAAYCYSPTTRVMPPLPALRGPGASSAGQTSSWRWCLGRCCRLRTRPFVQPGRPRRRCCAPLCRRTYPGRTGQLITQPTGHGADDVLPLSGEQTGQRIGIRAHPRCDS